MQKFALIFLVASVALLGLVSPVKGMATVRRETNAERFARGMPPLPPRFGTRTLSMFKHQTMYRHFILLTEECANSCSPP